MRERLTPLEKEWLKVERLEQQFIQKRMEKKDSKWNQLLEDKIPPTLQKTLDVAFSKAFYVVFEKGTGIIEKTYNKDDLEKTFQINEYAAQIRNNKKTLRTFSKKAMGSGAINTLVSGVSGIGLGVLGIGIPDIVLFTGLMLKSIYEIALNYGYDYQTEEEKKFILLLIRGAVSYGEQLYDVNQEVNQYIEHEIPDIKMSLDDCINEAAYCLSKELLYMKFLQGIPIVGAAGGAYDVIYMKQVVSYAEMKYRRRFYRNRMKGLKV